MQERPQQLEVEIAVGGFKVSGDVGHHPGTDESAGHLGLVVWFRLGLIVRGDAVAQEKVDDLLAGRLAGDPHAVSGGAGVDECRTTSIQSPGCPARSPLPTVAKASGVASNRVVAAVDVGSGVNQQTDHFGVPDVGGGVQRLLAEAVAGMRGEPQIEHEADGRDRCRAGGLDDRGAVVIGHPVTQVGMLGEESLRQ